MGPAYRHGISAFGQPAVGDFLSPAPDFLFLTFFPRCRGTIDIPLPGRGDRLIPAFPPLELSGFSGAYRSDSLHLRRSGRVAGQSTGPLPKRRMAAMADFGGRKNF